jgi:hypothetical protein
MIPAMNMEQFVEFYRNRGSKIDVGVWSFLLTPHADDDRRFADLYFKFFNGIAGVDWHLVNFTGWDGKNESDSGNEITWKSNEGMHVQSMRIRAYLAARGIEVPEMCIVFVNHLANEGGSNIVVVPIDRGLMGQPEFNRGLTKIKQALDATSRRLGSPHAVIGQQGYDKFLEALQQNIQMSKVMAICKKAAGFAFSALLSAAIGSVISS